MNQKHKFAVLSMMLLIVKLSSAQNLHPVCMTYPYYHVSGSCPSGVFYDSTFDINYLFGAGYVTPDSLFQPVKFSTGNACFVHDPLFDSIYCDINSMIRYNGNLWVGGNNSMISSSGTVYEANLIEFRPTGPYIYTCSASHFNDGKILGMKVLNGELYVFGDFDSIAGIRADKIAKYNGSAWSAFPLINDVGVVIVSAEWYQGELYIGGRFSDPGQGLLNIGRYNGTNWHSVGTGFPNWNSQVGTMMVFDNKLVVGGGMHTIYGDLGNCIQAWDGTSWSTFGSGFDAPWLLGVTALDTVNGELWAAGWFESNIYNVVNIAKWNGLTWDGMNINMDHWITDIQVTPYGVYISGYFTNVNGDSSLGKVFRIDNLVGQNSTSKVGLLISPNPTTGSINISGINKSFVSMLRLYNATGQIVKSVEIPMTSESIKIDMSNMVPGVYILEINSDSKRLRKKIVKI